jgi:hypothetical protein
MSSNDEIPHFIPSEEQQLIIDNIVQGNNVVVNAVAGSGKSTTIIAISQALKDKTILQITYNSMLRHELKNKIKPYQITNLKIHTFHSLAVSTYNETAHTDTELRRIILEKNNPSSPIPHFDLLVLDETQDMTPLYYKFIHKFLDDMTVSPTQILVLGDHRQCLYEFKGADARFLTMAEQIWQKYPPFSNTPFIHCSLQTSYRITKPIADFVNQAMLGEPLLKACRDGKPVSYIRNNRTTVENTVVYQIRELIKNGSKPSDIFVLAGSVKGLNSMVRRIENILVENNIPCYIPMVDSEKLDERVIEGKVVFSTFHCVKGRQRKHVFIFGFDYNYFNLYGRTLDKTKCPNTLYVGCTRSIETLCVVELNHYSGDRPLDFLRMTHIEMKNSPFVSFLGTPGSLFYLSEKEMNKKNNPIEKRYLTPTQLIKFIPDHTMDEIIPILNRIFTKQKYDAPTTEQEEEHIIPIVTKTASGFFEDISDLNGIAIPAMYFDNLNRQTFENETVPNNSKLIQTNINSYLVEMKENEHLFFKTIIKTIPTNCHTIQDYLFLANIQISIQERLYFKLKQIEREEYNWLTHKMVENCHSFMNSSLKDENIISTETTIIHHQMETLHEKIDACLLPFFNDINPNIRFRFTAIVDVITSHTLWEIKCTNQITIEHLLQLVIYSWIWGTLGNSRLDFKLMNIKTYEIWTLDATDLNVLTEIVVLLLRGKYFTPEIITDENFLENII